MADNFTNVGTVLCNSENLLEILRNKQYIKPILKTALIFLMVGQFNDFPTALENLSIMGSSCCQIALGTLMNI